MSQEAYQELAQELTNHGPGGVLRKLSEQLKHEQKYHELFDVLLMETRQRLGLPAVLSTPLDDLPEPERTELENAYLAACREVGTLLLAEGKVREAWMYLRPLGDRGLVAGALARITPNEENLQDLIEISLHEGVAPALGFELVLKNYGTCNAITTFEGSLTGRSRADQQAAAALLLRQLHTDLIANVRADIERQQSQAPTGDTLAELVADRDWLFTDNNYHIDTTHLAATVRFARLLTDTELVRMALDLTEYGRHLGSQFQFPGEEPFANVYPTHGLFFAAQLGQRVDEATEYFGRKARELDPAELGTGAIEIYIELLVRLKRYEQALEAAGELIPPGMRTSGFAPGLFELAQLSGRYDQLRAICERRGDLVGYAAALLEGRAQVSDGERLGK
jgi:hypothetical protein